MVSVSAVGVCRAGLMHDNGIEPDGYATISPDVWRRLLLDYESLGEAYKYAGHLTSRELVRYYHDDADVREALDTTDRVVYGNLEIEDEAVLARAFQQLRGFAERRYAELAAG